MSPEALRRVSALWDAWQAQPAHERATWLTALAHDEPKMAAALGEMDRAARGPSDGLSRGVPAFDEAQDAGPASLRAPDERIGPYRLLRLLGRGGMGEVWLAENDSGALRRPVALKLLHASGAPEGLRRRFARERDILVALAHPNIARLYDAGTSEQGQPYLAMEFVDGQPLMTHCDAAALGLQARLDLFAQVLEAVQHAHANLVVHRDLKPGNILVTADRRVLLLDFGIAKLLAVDMGSEAGAGATTQLAGAAMTPEYASPEQILQQPISIASDIYSLGVLLYELLAGARPEPVALRMRSDLRSATLHEVRLRPAQAVTEAAAARRKLPARALARALGGDLEAIVMKALRVAPQERYATVEAMAQDLRRYRAGLPVLAARSRWLTHALRFVGRHRLAVGAGMLVAAGLVAGSALALWQARVAREEAAASRAVEAFLVDLFRTSSSTQSDPAKARALTAGELLSRGAERIEGAEHLPPAVRLRLLSTMSRLFHELGVTESAHRTQQQVVALRRQLEPGVSEALAADLAFLAATGNLVRPKAETSRLIDEAERMLDALGDQTSRVRGELEHIRTLSVMGNRQRGEPAARRAVEILRRHPESAALADALLAWAVCLADLGRAEEALRAVAEGLAVAERRQSRSELPLLHATAARSHAELGDVDRALASARAGMEEAARLRPAGQPPNSGELGAARALAEVLMAAGRPQEAWEALTQILSHTETQPALAERYGLTVGLVRTWTVRAAAAAASGRLEEAATDLRRIEPWLSRPNFSNFHRVRYLDALASAHAAAGRWREVRCALDAARPLHRELQSNGTVNLRTHAALRFELQRQTGEVDPAGDPLDDFLAPEGPKAAPSRGSLERAVMRLEQQVARRDWAAVRASAVAFMDAAAALPAPDLLGRARLALAATELASGLADSALRLAQDGTEVLARSVVGLGHQRLMDAMQLMQAAATAAGRPDPVPGKLTLRSLQGRLHQDADRLPTACSK